MIHPVTLFILTSSAIGAHIQPHSSSESKINLRTIVTSPATDSGPVIRTNITDQNGADVSSAFRIMVYSTPKVVATPDLTGRSDASQTGNPVNICHSRPDVPFVSSYCTRRGLHGASGSMQTFLTICQASSGSPSHRRRGRVVETGRCADNEICVDEGNANRSRVLPKLAFCVRKSEFSEIEDSKVLGIDLRRRNISLAISAADQKTPLEMKSIEIDAVDASPRNEDGQAVREGLCQNCVAISTQKLPHKVALINMKGLIFVHALVNSVLFGIIWIFFFNN